MDDFEIYIRLERVALMHQITKLLKALQNNLMTPCPPSFAHKSVQRRAERKARKIMRKAKPKTTTNEHGEVCEMVCHPNTEMPRNKQALTKKSMAVTKKLNRPTKTAMQRKRQHKAARIQKSLKGRRTTKATSMRKSPAKQQKARSMRLHPMILRPSTVAKTKKPEQATKGTRKSKADNGCM